MANQETSLLAMRFSRLTSAGIPDDGSNNGWAAGDPIKVDLQFQYDSGTDVVQKDGAGRICFARKRPDNLKNAQVKFETCGGDPKMLELILNGDGETVGSGTVTGFGLQNASCASDVRNGIFIEWWTEQYNCNAVDATVPNARHFLPRVIVNYDGGTWDEARHAFAFTGVCNAGVVNNADVGGASPSGNTKTGGPFNDIEGFAYNTGYLYGYTVKGDEDEILTWVTDRAGTALTVPAQT